VLQELELIDDWGSFFRVYFSLRDELSIEDRREVHRAAASALQCSGPAVKFVAPAGFFAAA
jgi:hypothetical protein